nr:MAG TPA: hypothetical protein [Caudoviricetes sp.]
MSIESTYWSIFFFRSIPLLKLGMVVFSYFTPTFIL